MSTFPGEFRGTPAVQSSWGITRASAGARGERRERDAAPERARGPKQASGMCLARRARSRSSARAARAAPPRARLSSLGSSSTASDEFSVDAYLMHNREEISYLCFRYSPLTAPRPTRRKQPTFLTGER